MTANKLYLTFFPNLFAKSGQICSFSNLENLGAKILWQGPKATSPRFSSGIYASGGRGQKSFQKTNLLILDFDNGFKIEDVKEEFKNYKCIIAPTLSHSKSLHKFRVILALDREITNVRDYKATTKQFAHLNYDPASEIASQLWAFSKSIYFLNENGQPALTLAAPPEEAKPPAAAFPKGERGVLSKRFWRFWSENAGDGERYRERLYCSTELFSQNYSLEQAIKIINKSKDHSEEQKEKWIKVLEGVYKREYRFDFRPRNAPSNNLASRVLKLIEDKEDKTDYSKIEREFEIELLRSFESKSPQTILKKFDPKNIKNPNQSKILKMIKEFENGRERFCNREFSFENLREVLQENYSKMEFENIDSYFQKLLSKKAA